MSTMRGAHDYRTICEVLREINDLSQSPGPLAKRVRGLLCEAEDMAKRMSRRLYEYNQQWDRGFWVKNPDKAADMERRLSEKYCVG